MSTETTDARRPAATGPGQPSLLRVESLRIAFPGPSGPLHPVQDISFSVAPGETLAIVGESGSGKSLTALSLLDLVPRPGVREAGTITWRGHTTSREDLRGLRGGGISMVFQDPLATLNPLMTVGRQITEVLRRHRGMSRRDADAEAVDLLRSTGIPEPSERARQFPHEFSGGMAQRAMIAMALAAQPELLIADEPTSALDVTIQAQILGLLADIQDRLGISIVLISHDLGVVAATSDRVVVMYAGQVMEQGPVRAVLRSPRHHYTAGLLASTPRLDRPRTLMHGISGAPPRVSAQPRGCPFAPRCGAATDVCRQDRPSPTSSGGTEASCWHPIAVDQ